MPDAGEHIVINGAGLACGLGLSREQTWQAILRGECALRPLTVIESTLPSGADGGEALPLPADFVPELPREARYLRWTIADAIRDAGLGDSFAAYAERCALVLGTTLHGMRAAGRFVRSGDYAALRDFLAGDTLRLAVDGLGLGGRTVSLCSACSSSLAAVAMAATLLQTGEADLVIAGGYDAIGEYVYGGFNSLRLIAAGPVRPFARDRQGMKLAEGFGIVILERQADASRRGANPLATILGSAETSDAHHLTQPHPQGEGAARAMNAAITAAGLTPADIDLVAAHATGTRDNDAGEYAALSRVFGERLKDVPVVGFKSHLGHTLGGAGAVELICSAMALRDQTVPACVNVTAGDVEFPGLYLATGTPRHATLKATLNTSLGFGGSNACMILGNASAAATTAPRTKQCDRLDAAHDVLITGIGIVLPGITGNDAFLKRLTASDDQVESAWRRDAGAVPEAQLEGLLNARRVRRMSDYVKLTLAAATLALRDAGVADDPAFAESCAAVLGTMHGSSNFSVDYYRQIVKEGLIAANPIYFAEGVPNAGAAQLSLMLSIKGPCQAVIGTRTAGLDALSLATSKIRSGLWDRAIVGGGEEHCAVVTEAHRRCGQAAVEGSAPFGAESGFVCGAGAVIFLVESRRSLEQRGGRARGRVTATAATYGSRAHGARSIGRVLTALGDPANILSSACGTWIDRAEANAINRSKGARRVSCVYGHIAETYSASPLAAIAAVLLRRALPRLAGGGWPDSGDVRAADGTETIDAFAALCTDFTGAASGVGVKII